MSELAWMAWTKPTALFFASIALVLAAMTLWEILSPSGERKGILRMRTTRGDRLFISLLGSAYIHLAWLGLAEGSLLGPAVLSGIFAVSVFRWA